MDRLRIDWGTEGVKRWLETWGEEVEWDVKLEAVGEKKKRTRRKEEEEKEGKSSQFYLIEHVSEGN